MAERPKHHEQRPSARQTIDRLAAVQAAVGGRQALYELVGGVELFRQLIAQPNNIDTYLGKQQSLPREEILQRINRFLEYVEPAIAEGRPISAAALRAYLRAGIEQRAARSRSATR